MLSPQILAEYEALTHGAAFVDVSNRTKIELRGSDRVKILHNFCTNDIRSLQPGQSCEAFVCNLKGHVLGHVLVYCDQDALLLDTAPDQAQKLVAHLDRYVIREDVKILDQTAEFDAVVLSGDQLPEISSAGWTVPITGHGARLLWSPVAERDQFRQTLRSAGLTEASHQALEIVRIEHGFPWYGIDLSEENLAQEVGRDEQTLSFTKGCYLGQETVARLASLGHVNRLLCRVAFSSEQAPATGMELVSGGKTVGHVTSACWSPKFNGPLALAYLRRGFLEPGTVVQSSIGEGTVVAVS